MDFQIWVQWGHVERQKSTGLTQPDSLPKGTAKTREYSGNPLLLNLLGKEYFVFFFFFTNLSYICRFDIGVHGLISHTMIYLTNFNET